MPNPLYTYILDMIWFGLVWFYGISTIVGYLMPNLVYIYKIYIFTNPPLGQDMTQGQFLSGV